MEKKDYNDLYEKHLMCRNCNRETPQGESEYISKKTGKVTKTCLKCRDSVRKSLIKKPQKRPLTMKNKIKKLENEINDLKIKLEQTK